MAIGSVMSAGVGLSDTPNPYTNLYYGNIGKSAFNTADSVNNATGGSSGTQNAQKGEKKQLGKFQDGFGEECQTCKNRKYQDESDDSSVSFQTPTKIAKGAELSRVLGHEYEHVANNQAEADREGREVVSQSVTVKTGICPECGKAYVAGGETRTVTKNKTAQKFDVGLNGGNATSGKAFSAVA